MRCATVAPLQDLSKVTLALVCIVPAALIFALTPLRAQTTIATGSIQGTVLDPSDAVVPNAPVSIINHATGQVLRVTSNSAGNYTSGALLPGTYIVRIECQGFKTLELPVTVQVGVTAAGDVRLHVGPVEEVVQVPSASVAVNTEQVTVEGVLNSEQVDVLPINGRKFLDLAQLEPGVQIQDGRNTDPAKIGFVGVSVGGRDGAKTRIEVDGIDITDEDVGTTTTGVALSAIQEFQVSQSFLDLSTELTSGGAVNVATRSGTNDFHGGAFDFFRDSSLAAALPGPNAPFQGHQFGARFGGPLVKNKFLFFADGERTKRDLFQPVPLPDPFAALSGGFNSPFHETNLTGRLDWQLKTGASVFYRYAYYQDFSTSTLTIASYRPLNNKDYATTHVLGADFHTGRFTHSFRWGYLDFRNNITDAVRDSSLPLAALPVGLVIDPLRTGPSALVPQATRQSNHQAKYDGSKALQSHIFRYGVSFNLLRGGGYLKFFGLTPTVFTELGSFEENFADNSCGTGQPCFAGGRANPLNYPVENVIIGNGQGFPTERPAFGFLGGGTEDHRIGLYWGDSWKLRNNLTVTYGLRYVRDSGKTNSDLPAIPALNEVLPGMGNRVRQPNLNFAPQAGMVWDPWKDGKTVLRVGVGLFFENVLWNDTYSDRSSRLPQGAFLSFPNACFQGGTAVDVLFADGSVHHPSPEACGTPGNPIAIGLAASSLAAFQNYYQLIAASVGLNAINPNFIGNEITSGIPLLGGFAPDFRTPRSIQVNAGVERELRRGLVLGADYLRNVSLHFILGIDANHVGDASLLNIPAAVSAISATNALFGCGSGTDPASIDCAILNHASIADFALLGLDSPAGLGAGALGIHCAFAGLNPNIGPATFGFTSGRAVYNALQIRLRQDVNTNLPFLQHLRLQTSYALSRFVSSDLVDNHDPLRFTGPSGFDRTHQISFGGVADLPASFRAAFISHFYTALPLSLTVPNTNLGPGEIFRTDFTGDGTWPDPLPGTRNGSFGRDIKSDDLNAAITNYNNTVAGQPTPAGQALMKAGLFSNAQLRALGAVAPPVSLAPKGHVGLDALRSFDLKLSWTHHLHDRLTIEPSVTSFNVFNFANFDLPPATLSGSLNGGAGAVNGYDQRISNRLGVGTGVFGLGAPRVIEFGLSLTF